MNANLITDYSREYLLKSLDDTDYSKARAILIEQYTQIEARLKKSFGDSLKFLDSLIPNGKEVKNIATMCIPIKGFNDTVTNILNAIAERDRTAVLKEAKEKRECYGSLIQAIGFIITKVGDISTQLLNAIKDHLNELPLGREIPNFKE